MERAILIAIALFALAAWRVVFMLLQQRLLPSATPPPRQSKDKQHRPQWLLPCVELTTESGLGPGFVRAESRADTYLRRVIALTGARKNWNNYFLDVGTIRFQVWDRFIVRLRDNGDPKGEETCFGPAFQSMPKAERIATALLQLHNDPALFEKWAKKDRAFKADGQPFRREAVSIWQ
jgi:hypothetical protein